MGDLIVVHPDFDGVWPFAADHFRTLWPEAGFVRLAHGDERPLGTVVEDPSRVTRLVTLGDAGGPDVLAAFYGLAGSDLSGVLWSAARRGL